MNGAINKKKQGFALFFLLKIFITRKETMEKNKIYKLKIEYNEPSKDYTPSSMEKRANTIYNHPDNEKTVKRQKTGNNQKGLQLFDEYNEIPIAEPKKLAEPNYMNTQKDLQKERRNTVSEIRKQNKTVNNSPIVSPKKRTDYINKSIENKQETAIFSNTNNNTGTIEWNKKPKKQIQEKNYEEIAEIFYPNMETKSKTKINPNKESRLSKTENELHFEDKKQSSADVKQKLYHNYSIADKESKKLYDLTKVYKDTTDYEDIANVLYPKTSSNPKINKLREEARSEETEREKNLKNKILQYRIGAVIIISLGAVPIARETILTTAVGRTAVAYLAPLIGKKVSELLVQLVIENFIIGGITGLGDGLLEDKNPVESTIKGAVLGSIFGMGIALGIGKIGKELAKKEIERVGNKDELLQKYYAEYVDGISTRTKELIEYRRLNAGAARGKREVLYDRIERRSRQNEIHLDKEEYANLMHELNTNLTADERKKKIIERSIGDNVYTIINNGFNEYKIIGKKVIECQILAN